MYVKQNQNQSKNVSEYPLFCVQWLLTTVMNDLSFRLVARRSSTGSIPMRFLRKNCGDFRISYVKIADQNLERSADEMGWRGMERTRGGRSAPGGASLPRFPFGVLFLMVFFFIPIRPIIFFPPVTMISTDCSSCSFVSSRVRVRVREGLKR